MNANVTEKELSEKMAVSLYHLRQIRKANMVEDTHFVVTRTGLEYLPAGVELLSKLTAGALTGATPEHGQTQTPLRPEGYAGQANTDREKPPEPPTLPAPRHRKGVVVRLWGNPRLIQVRLVPDGQLVNAIVHQNTDWVLKMEIPVITPDDNKRPGLWHVGCGRPVARGRLPNAFRWDTFLGGGK